MANPDHLNDFNFDAAANPHYAYGSRLSWPVQQPQSASPSAATNATAATSKR